MTSKAVSDLLPPGRVAELFGVCKATITTWVRRGELACEYTTGHQRRFTRAVVRARLAALGKPIPRWLEDPPVELIAPLASNDSGPETRSYPLGEERGAFLFALPPAGLRRVDVERIRCHLLSFAVD
jgi:hypothetical protein